MSDTLFWYVETSDCTEKCWDMLRDSIAVQSLVVPL